MRVWKRKDGRLFLESYHFTQFKASWWRGSSSRTGPEQARCDVYTEGTNFKPNCSIQPQASVCWSTAVQIFFTRVQHEIGRMTSQQDQLCINFDQAISRKHQNKSYEQLKLECQGHFHQVGTLWIFRIRCPRTSERITSGASPKTRQYNIF